jgi:hypothetical protein
MARKRRQPRAARVAAKRQLIDEAAALLLAAIVLLDGPRRWSRRAYALDGRGRSVAVDDPRASRFCLAGALLRAEHLANATPMPIRTDPAPEVDDLLAPIVPPDAPTRLHLALNVLAVASGLELQKLGMRFRFLNLDADERVPTVLHRPLLLGLHPKARFVNCEQALEMALGIVAWIAKDDDRVDESIWDEALRR